MKKRAFGKLYKELFYIPKHEKLPDKVFRCRLVISLLTILACTAVLAASTFALFFAEISTDNSTLVGAYYSVTVDNAENGTYICPLAFEDKHTFEIKADGTATSGHCKIRVGDTTYYTEQIPQGHSLVLTVQAAKDTVITFTSEWSMLFEDTCGNEIIHSATPHAVYRVEPTAKLANIAAHYGVTEPAILTYNNLSVADDLGESTIQLDIGTELKIPGVPYDTPSYVAPIPEPPTSSDENQIDDIQGENDDPPSVDDTVFAGNIEKNEQPSGEAPSTEDTNSSGDEKSNEQPTADDTTAESNTNPSEQTAEYEIYNDMTKEQTVEKLIFNEPVINREIDGYEQPTEEPSASNEVAPLEKEITE